MSGRMGAAALAGHVAARGAFVIVQMLPDADRVGLIIMPGTKSGRPNKAKVLSHGDGHYTRKDVFVPSELSIGDVVVVDPYRFEVVLADGQLANAQGTPYAGPGDVAVIHEGNVLAVLTEQST